MEYSVYDLIKILFRKWYVIVLTMIAFGVMSIIFSYYSYNKVMRDYEKYVTEIENEMENGGLFEVEYELEFSIINLNIYEDMVTETPEEREFIRRYLNTYEIELNENSEIYKKAMLAYEDCLKCVNNLLNEVTLADNIKITKISETKMLITAYGESEKALENEIVDALNLLQGVAEKDNVQLEFIETSRKYSSDVDEKKISTIIMKKPPEKHAVTGRTVGTAMIFGIAIACFVILVVTFVRDTAQASKGEM